MTNKFLYLTFLICFGFANIIFADILVLKSGKKYKGSISRAKSGKIIIKNKNFKLEFNENLVSFRLSKFTPPKNAEKAFKLLKNKKYKQALPFFDNWMKRFNNLPVIWFERALYGKGICLANTGKTEQSLKLLQKLIDTFPKSKYRNEAEYWLIETQLSGKPGPELEKKLLKLINDKNTPDKIKAKAHQGLAKYYNSINKKKKALEEYVKIIVLYGDIDDLQQDAQENCANLFLQIGRTNEAKFYSKQIMDAN